MIYREAKYGDYNEIQPHPSEIETFKCTHTSYDAVVNKTGELFTLIAVIT